MRVLVLSITCGQGHNAIAKSIKNAFDETDTVEVFDIMGINPKYAVREHKLYMFALKNIPHIYDYFWNKLRNKNPNKRYSKVNLGSYVDKTYDFNLKKINEFKPDAIICTHNYASNLCAKYIMDNKIRGIKVYSVLFDYVACPFWETSVLCDKIFTPSELTHKEMLDRGYIESQLLPIGYPIDPKFGNQLDKLEMRAKLGVDKNDFMVMSMSGGFGQGNSLKLVKYLSKLPKYEDKNFSYHIICGKNEKQKNKILKYLQKHNIDFVKVYGFVNNVEEFMSATDVMITRGGGNSLSETFQKGVVPIIRENMIINEKINKEIFMQKNMAYGLEKTKDITKVLQFIISNPSDLELKQKNIAKFAFKDSAKNIAKYVKNN